ncbi:MAG: succinate dehydrogenase cytochrome b subunit [Aureispira sp.]
MKWIIDFLLSSLGKKLVMSLTGLFLCSFLIMHMIGNLQLFVPDGGLTFNAYAYFMTHNPLIKTISYGLYAGILLHAFQGILITMQNRKAKGGKYQGKDISATKAKAASRNMAALGLLVFAFLGLHMVQFWGVMHFSTWPENGEILPGVQAFDAAGNKNLYGLVSAAFAQAWVVIFYLVALVALALHLLHGFWSAFQTLGLSNTKYEPIIRGAGAGFAILIPLGFAAMPIFFYITSLS